MLRSYDQHSEVVDDAIEVGKERQKREYVWSYLYSGSDPPSAVNDNLATRQHSGSGNIAISGLSLHADDDLVSAISIMKRRQPSPFTETHARPIDCNFNIPRTSTNRHIKDCYGVVLAPPNSPRSSLKSPAHLLHHPRHHPRDTSPPSAGSSLLMAGSTSAPRH